MKHVSSDVKFPLLNSAGNKHWYVSVVALEHLPHLPFDLWLQCVYTGAGHRQRHQHKLQYHALKVIYFCG